MKKEEYITDLFGRRIARKDTDDETGETTVSDLNGRVLGKADKNGTTDFFGKKLSGDDAPGLLFPKP